MIEKYRTWINLWVDQDGPHCVITKVFVKDGESHALDSFFRPSMASAIRLANIVCNAVTRGEGQIYPNVLGIGWSWQKGESAVEGLTEKEAKAHLLDLVQDFPEEVSESLRKIAR